MNGVVKLDEIVTSMDRDLVLYIQVVEPHKARLLAEVFKLNFYYPLFHFQYFHNSNFSEIQRERRINVEPCTQF